MKNLILFEIEKILKRRKNIIFFLCLLIITLIICFTFNNYDQNSLSFQIEQYRSKIELIDEVNVKDKEVLLNLYIKNLDSLQNKSWKEQLTTQIQLDQYLLENNISEYDPLNLINDRILKNKELLKVGISPINENYNMSSYNFILLFNKIIFPIFGLIFILLISSDIVSSERGEGTFKFLLIMPYSRRKVILSKILAASIVSILTLLLILLFGFFTLGAINGIGNPLYPMKFYNIKDKSFIFIGIRRFSFTLVFMNLILVLFLTSLGVLISTLFKDSVNAVSSGLIISSLIYMLNLKRIIAYSFMYLNPFSYISSFNVITGVFSNNTYNLIFNSFFIVLIFYTIFNSLMSLILFGKADII